MASLVFIQAKWFPLIVTRDDRAVYITALEQADRGDLSNLIQLFSQSQKQAFIRSLSLSERILPESRRTQVIIAGIAEKLKQRQSETTDKRCEKVEILADRLDEIARDRLENIAEEIKLSLQNLLDELTIFIDISFDDKLSSRHYYQVQEIARKLNYSANIKPYHQWIKLIINLKVPTIILLSFHVLGYEYRGLLVCSACAYHNPKKEDGERTITNLQVLTDTPFQFSYADEESNLVMRFQKWLEEALVNGLEYWNNSL